MKNIYPAFVTFLLLVAMTVGADPGTAQRAGAVRSPIIQVFLDCQTGGCDSQHFRNEIRFVNWVRERTAADVHVLITSQSAGGGGTEYQLTFLGARSFAQDTLTDVVVVTQLQSDSDRRDLLTNAIGRGLLYFARGTAAASRIRVVYDGPDDEAGLTASPVDDPWNFWVFSTRLSAEIDAQAREHSREFELAGSASRVTADWKLEFDLEGTYEEDRFELTDRTVTSVTKDYEAEVLVARSIARLWSAGITAEVGKSTYENQNFYARPAALLEYSFLPYDEFSRRRILLRYTVGMRHFDYDEITIYEQLSETRADHALRLATNFRQPWGSAWLTLQGSHYFHDVSRYNITGNGGVDIRLFRGLTLWVSANAARVHDQLYIPLGDADDEEVLLRRRALETNYRYSTDVGLRYTFGSVYNNIVNPRLGG